MQSKLSDSSINRNRYCTPSLLTQYHKLTGENSERTWLCYSPSNGHVYCFKCKLLLLDIKINSPFTQGFNHWKNGQRVEVHENSESHTSACLGFTQQCGMIGIDKHGNPGRGKTSYLSSTVCDELINLMGQKVLLFIVDEIQKAKYYSVSIDSTPDLSHVDQFSVIVHYVNKGEPINRFLTFIKFESHTGIGLSNALQEFLQKNNIDIGNCRGQTYDNTSNMSGCYNGVCKYAIYTSFFAHSLNLVGKNAVGCCTAAVGFFDIVQRIYTFFSASTHRLTILTKALAKDKTPVPKKLSDARWSAHADATSASPKGYKNILSALDTIATCLFMNLLISASFVR